jgi:diguanylate cyclase (GGDEF)-like protein
MAAVLFFDLDHFKHINDTLGHDVGDALLRSVAARVTWCLREVDTIARMGGDEFTIILSNVSGPREAAEVADRVMHAISQPVTIDGHEIVISASIGISLFPSDGENAETMVKNADAAMYRAKENGKNNYQFHSESLNVTANERMTMEKSLRKALKCDELVVFYQPRVDMATGHFHGTEALVRWRHPDMGLVSPGEFIPMAERTGLIVPLSECVLRAACRQNKAWQKAGFPEMDIAVNISTRLFHSDKLLEMVNRVLEEVGMDAKYLNLELSESVLMEDHDLAIEKLRELKNIGVRVSVDEFGTGDSSTSYLRQLPIDMLKIDPSLVKDIATNPSDAAVARAMISTAHSLGLTVIAVGVETLEQHSFLRSIECDQMQVYFVSPPVPADNLTEQLHKAQDAGGNVRSAA